MFLICLVTVPERGQGFCSRIPHRILARCKCVCAWLRPPHSVASAGVPWSTFLSREWEQGMVLRKAWGHIQHLDLFSFFFFFFLAFRAAPAAYGGSQARDRIGAKLPACTTATVTPDPSRVCVLHHSSRQRWILNPLSEARHRTQNLMVPNRIRFRCATMGTPAP